MATSARTPRTPRPDPNAPPNSDNRTLSVSNWEMMRRRPAPRATRSAISASAELLLRAKIRHIGASDQEHESDAPSKMNRAERTSPTTMSRSGSTVALSCGSILSGNCAETPRGSFHPRSCLFESDAGFQARCRHQVWPGRCCLGLAAKSQRSDGDPL